MRRARWLLLLGLLTVSVLTAFFLRDVLYRAVVVPVAYVIWLIWLYYSAVPQIFLWVAFVIILLIAFISNFVPEGGASRRAEHKHAAPQGQVEALSVWMIKARRGNYFKWQIANRLGAIRHEMNESFGERNRFDIQNEAVENYFDAGVNKSFVDFPLSRNPLHPARTPLDLNPAEAVEYLESQMEHQRGRHS